MEYLGKLKTMEQEFKAKAGKVFGKVQGKEENKVLNKICHVMLS